jgi:hypothetical protein
MSIEVIPAGSSAVVTDHHRGDYGRDNYRNDNGVALMGAIKDAEADVLRTVKDAEADLERSGGLHYGATVTAIKDAQAAIERGAGLHYGASVTAVKDAQASIERGAGLHYADTVKTIKDAEAQLDRASGDRFGRMVEDIKDAEARLDRASGDRFIKTIEDVKESTFTTEKAKAKLVELVKESELENLKAEARTRELLQHGFKEVLLEDCKGFDDVKRKVERVERDLACQLINGFKDQIIESKQAAYERAQNQAVTMMGFKDTQLQLAAVKSDLAAQLAECCCETKLMFAAQTANILADGQKTRELINANEVADLREKLSEAKARSRRRSYIPATPGTLISTDDE